MQVSVEAGEGLQRKMTVEVPFETLETEIESRLQSIKGRVKIDGFRPGKVPLKVVKQRYGEQVLHEVAADVMQRSFQDAVTQQNLRLAGAPTIHDEVIRNGEPLQYVAEFEIYPEITVFPVGELKLEKYRAGVADADVDGMMETLRKQQTGWSDKDGESADGDRVTIDFVGRIDGEAFDGGTASGVPLVLGSGSMIPGFEEKLAGQAQGSEITFEVPFPDDYQASHLAGKMAEFSVTVGKVEQSSLPELDDDFAKLYGIDEGGIGKLRNDVRNNLERELDNRIKASLKNSVMDQLLEQNRVDVPSAIVDEEVGSMQNARPGEDADTLRSEAERRVKLGLILGELVKQASIQPSREMIDQRIEMMARDYEDPSEFINHYRGNPDLLRGIESLVIEDMMVDWIAEQATVTEVDKTFDELMKPSA